MVSHQQQKKLEVKAKELRKTILKMIYKAQSSHIAPAFSVLDIILFLYEKILKINPRKPWNIHRDRLLLSKGWGISALYAVLAKHKFFKEKLLGEYCSNGSKFIGTSTLNGIPGIETTTGSMGHGLPLGVGMAIASKRAKKEFRTFVIISDGELDEGSTWEAILFAGHHKLDNLTVIVDYNKFQAFGRVRDILDLEPLAEKFKAFNWSTKEMNGHDFYDMGRIFKKLPFEKGMPSIVIAHTVKGKGVSFMENNNVWHYRPPNETFFNLAMQELK